ncbi:hypothetical protein IV498_04335 [Paenarthrobacter sp. Z7-10]|uniref:hypothetical protein n=1 Tax=Paenarthrobacter sp. Z7-10 TaxID=2787635 RepID=UPI0022A9020B|nr:hypothetical protein [Paenarthrobacter sp. Z7-10]MCZ2402429.1 hypothetical protein [Paenarthrobacter sp. Z7-10]
MGQTRNTRYRESAGTGPIVRSLVGGAAFLVGIVVLVIGIGSIIYSAFNSGFRDWQTPVMLALVGAAMMVVTVVLLSDPAPGSGSGRTGRI